MTLRQTLGGDADRLHELLEELLDSEDVVVLLFDGDHAVNYINRFGSSPSQHELMALEIERTVRAAGATGASGGRGRSRGRLTRRVQAEHDPTRRFEQGSIKRRPVMFRTNWTAQAIDDVLAGTFPASDPPAWTPGMARPAPEIAARAAERGTAEDETNEVRASDVIDVSRPGRSERTFAEAVVSLMGTAGIALLVPVAILAAGTPWRSVSAACSN